MSYGSGPHLSAKVGSSAATCPMTPDLTSRLRWASMQPCILWLQTLPPDRGGLRRYQVFYDSEPHLPIEVSSGATTYPVTPCGPRASSIMKSLPVLPVQLGTHVPNVCAQVSKVSDRVYKMCGQAALSMPAKRADMQVQCDYSTTPALWITRLSSLQCQATRQHGTTLLTECSVAGDKTRYSHAVEDIICYS
jgi:hypothetical protein